MYKECVSPLAHEEDLGACSSCDTLICHACNPKGKCDGGCPIVKKRKAEGSTSFTLRLEIQEAKPKKKKKKIHVFDRGERRRRDVLRFEPPGTPFYGYVHGIDEEEVRGGDNLFHLDMECFSARWFDKLQDDLSDLPKWIALPKNAAPCRLSLVVTGAVLDVMTQGKLKLREHAWVRLWLQPIDQDRGPVGTPVRFYLPPNGSTNPLLIPSSGLWTDDFEVLLVERVRPTTGGTRKLNRLWATIAAQDYSGDQL